jgi:hypothetical protein
METSRSPRPPCLWFDRFIYMHKHQVAAAFCGARETL